MSGSWSGVGLPWLLMAGVALLAAVVLTLMALAYGGAAAGSRYRSRFTGDVGRRLNDLLLFVDAQRLFRWNLLLALLVMAAIRLTTGSWLLMALGVVGIAMLPNLVLVRLARQRRLSFAGQLPDALMLVSAAIRSGASLPLALRQMSQEMAAPCGQEFELMLREQRLGVTLDEALGSLERRMGGDDLRLFTAAVRIAGDSGGNLAETLERLADSIAPQADRGREDPRANRPGAPAGLDHDAASTGGRCRALCNRAGSDGAADRNLAGLDRLWRDCSARGRGPAVHSADHGHRHLMETVFAIGAGWSASLLLAVAAAGDGGSCC